MAVKQERDRYFKEWADTPVGKRKEVRGRVSQGAGARSGGVQGPA